MKITILKIVQIKDVLENDVVVLWSGGPDSTGLIHMLLNGDYHGKIFPLFVNRGQQNYGFEKQSILYYARKFKKIIEHNSNLFIFLKYVLISDHLILMKSKKK